MTVHYMPGRDESSMRQVHCSLMRCVAVLLLSVVNENIAGGNPCRAFSVKRRNKYYARGVALPAADVDLGMGFQNGSLRWGTAGVLCCGLPLFHTPVVDSSHVYLCRGNLIPRKKLIRITGTNQDEVNRP